VAPMVGSGGSLEPSGPFCVGAFGGNVTPVAVNIFFHSINSVRKF
jgi:hypothetical protein